jgi:hypothetical protein
MPIRPRRISTACILVLAAITGACADANPAGVAVPEQPAHSVSIAAATAWTASGPGNVTVDPTGTTMTYGYLPSDGNLYTWDFETTAERTATVTIPWSYNGESSVAGFGGARGVVYAVVNDAVVATLIDQNVGRFSFSGTYTFTVSAGDTYGFRFGGVSDNTLARVLIGTFTVVPPEAPADPATQDDCKDGGWMAFGFRNQGQCVAFVETGNDSR